MLFGSTETRFLCSSGLRSSHLRVSDCKLEWFWRRLACELTYSVIPITESMREPHKFPPVLSGVMLIVAVLFAGFGVLGYAAYGSDIQTVVIVNLPQDDKFVQAVQFLCQCQIADHHTSLMIQTRSPSSSQFPCSFSLRYESWRTACSPDQARTIRRSNGKRTSSEPAPSFSARCCLGPAALSSTSLFP